MIEVIENKIFGRLTVVSRNGSTKDRKNSLYLCSCVCGKETIVPRCHLITGHTKSCGCYNIDLVKERNIKNRKFSKLEEKLCNNLRNRLKQALKKEFKSGSAVRDLGCTIQEFKSYIEKKFYPNPKTEEQMTWENWGRFGWHIDHIVPLSKFDLSNREELLKVCHYTNLQPMWWF